eukprot:TRINITY_DN114005_c0_g1_i1.p1 TRINITY_DN114005_c0_g1~~TRINITY_DN114005_c0_g1_i1.p1  ORF type:complete len:144 (+),score=31.35 TRINITY_DN114005_c0_g1_i1:54-434(+)
MQPCGACGTRPLEAHGGTSPELPDAAACSSCTQQNGVSGAKKSRCSPAISEPSRPAKMARVSGQTSTIAAAVPGTRLPALAQPLRPDEQLQKESNQVVVDELCKRMTALLPKQNSLAAEQSQETAA